MNPEDLITKQELIDRLNEENRTLRAENAKLRKGLEDIVKHQRLIGGTMAEYSSVLRIARKALAEIEVIE